MKFIELKESPKYTANENLAPKGDEDDRCACCNKPLNSEGKWFVHMTTSWEMVPNEVSEEQLPEFGKQTQGCFPLGNACAKKIPAGYRTKF